MSSSITNETLRIKVKQLQALLSHTTQTVCSPLPSTNASLSADDALHPLQLLRDAAKLLYAHATKIGLLLINDPYTPSAIHKELVACEGQCIPGLLGAVESCHPAAWTTTVAKEVRLRTEAAISALGLLLLDVKNKAEGGTIATTTTRQKEKTLASTGQVWHTCEVLIALERQGIAGIVTKKAQEYRDMLKDAMEELEEWGEDEDDQDEGFVGSDDEEGDGGNIENMFDGQRLPAHREDLKALLVNALKKLKLIDMLFQALLKRRLKTVDITDPPHDPSQKEKVQRVGDLITLLKSISNGVDEFANSLYELDASHAQAQLDRVLERATQTAIAMDKSWTGTDDEFTTWSRRWKAAIAKKADANVRVEVA